MSRYCCFLILPDFYCLLKDKYKEKIAKYIALAAEIKQLWKVEDTKIVPIIIETAGEVAKSLKESLRVLDIPSVISMEI